MSFNALGTTRHGMAVEGCGSGAACAEFMDSSLLRGKTTAFRVLCGGKTGFSYGMLRVFCHHVPRPLRLPDDHAQTISNIRVFGSPAEARSKRVQPPTSQGMPAA